MQHSQEIDKVSAALVKAQGEMPTAPKDSTGYYKNKYADLLTIWNTCRPVLSKHGLAVIQTCEPSDSGTLLLTTTLVHESGQYFSGTMTMPVEKLNCQEIGIAMTYGCRYGLAPMIGLVGGVDDDGEGAMKRDKAEAKVPRTRTVTKAKEATKADAGPDAETSAKLHADFEAEIWSTKTVAALEAVGQKIARANKRLTDSDRSHLSGVYPKHKQNLERMPTNV